jgi:hypothetical protein
LLDPTFFQTATSKAGTLPSAMRAVWLLGEFGVGVSSLHVASSSSTAITPFLGFIGGLLAFVDERANNTDTGGY